jgi:hydrogenase 3 maturation protease
MTTSRPLEILRFRVTGAGRLAVVGIGDELNPPDRLGMYAARQVDQHRVQGVKVFFAGTVPESITGPLRRYRPGHVLFLDAADMGVRPGTIAVIEPEHVRATLLSTHVLPLTVVMDYVQQESGSGVTLLGIQPDLTGPGRDLSGADLAFLDKNLLLLTTMLRNR